MEAMSSGGFVTVGCASERGENVGFANYAARNVLCFLHTAF